MRAAVLEDDRLSVQATARELRDLAPSNERESGLIGVAGRLEEIYAQDAS